MVGGVPRPCYSKGEREHAVPNPSPAPPRWRIHARMSASTGTQADAMGTWLWVLLGGAACAAMAPLEPNLLEEGLMLHVGERMLDGDHLYRDVELVTGPVPYALTALLFALFGEDVRVARAAVVALQALASGAVFAMARRAGAGPWAHAAAACFASGPVLFFPLLSTMFYTTIATSLAIVSASLGLRAIASRP